MADNTAAVDTRQDSAASCTVGSQNIHDGGNVSRRWHLDWEQLRRPTTGVFSRDIQSTVTWTHSLWGVGVSFRPGTTLQ